MIGIDTNILLRHMLDDDARQTHLASSLLEASKDAGGVIVNTIVLIEFVWTLGRREGFKKAEILQAFDVLAGANGIRLAERACVSEAIEAWRTGPADFADYLIGALNRAAGASTTYTFDKDAAVHADFTRLA